MRGRPRFKININSSFGIGKERIGLGRIIYSAHEITCEMLNR